MPFTFSIRFYEELNDFLPKSRRKKTFSHSCFGTPTVKDIIESLGVPHTEVDLILVNSEAVTFSHKPVEGDAISVYPVFESLDISSINRLRPEPLRQVRFVADVHLGKLAKALRILGFDTLYRNDLEDDEIVDISVHEKRIVLTRDLGLLKNNRVTHGYYVRSIKPDPQTREVLLRFDLIKKTTPFNRCTECNGSVQPVSLQEVRHLLSLRTQKYYDEFFQCDSCHKVYWKGSHYMKMLAWVTKITALDI